MPAPSRHAASCLRVQVRMRIALDTMQYQGSIVACLANIGSKEGVRALYFGLPATIAGIIPFSSMKLATCVRHAAAAPSPNPTFAPLCLAPTPTDPPLPRVGTTCCGDG